METTRRRWRLFRCSSVPDATKLGPGSVHIRAWEQLMPPPQDRYFTGASYISIPASMPPSMRLEAPWLQAEGVLGFVWGGIENLFANTAQLLGVLGATKRRRWGIVSTLEGTASCEAPESWRYTNSIIVNSTEYSSSGTTQPEYTSEAGSRLSLEGFTYQHTSRVSTLNCLIVLNDVRCSPTMPQNTRAPQSIDNLTIASRL